MPTSRSPAKSTAPAAGTSKSSSKAAAEVSSTPDPLGGAGELHHVAKSAVQSMTTNHGPPNADDQSSLKAGWRRPTLLEDFVLREKITHFDHERIPERVVHARGSGAHGYFQPHASCADITRASSRSCPRACT